MSRVGRWCAIGAALLATLTLATWDAGAGAHELAAPLDGADLFRAKGCASCHDGPSTRPMIAAGFPSLADAPRWAGDRRDGMSATEYLAESIASPAAFISPAFTGANGPTDRMPQLRLTREEIDALVEYLLAD